MLLTVRHEISYAFARPASHVVEIVRLMPGNHGGQDVLDWRVRCPTADGLSAFTDGLGNEASLISQRGPVERFTVIAEGQVRTVDLGGVVAGAVETMPPAYYLRRTDQTAPTEPIVALAKKAAGEKAVLGREALAKLAAGVAEQPEDLSSEPDETASEAETEITEPDAGAAPERAHVFIAAARALGVPARCVSGYLWTGEEKGASEEADRPFAPHAWAEAWTEADGWVGFDPAQGGPVGAAHVRVAIGLDYRQAAPVTSHQRGAGELTLDVFGHIQAAESGQ
ncbi:MAG: transglutaminase family protein [Maricaulaceae bacterium]|jgi:transglutaminase-like putative cysteine protease